MCGAAYPALFHHAGLQFPGNGGQKFLSVQQWALQVRTKTLAQHAAAALSGSRSSSSLRCLVESTLQYTTPNNPPHLQDTPPLSSTPLPPDPQESVTPALLNPAVGSQTDDQSSVLPVAGLKIHSPVNNPYVGPSVRQVAVVNKVANTIHSPEDGPTKECYGWDLMLNGDSDDHPTHISVGKDFTGLEDTLNNVLQ